MNDLYAPMHACALMQCMQTNPRQRVLNLADYACLELLVSFAVVSGDGISNFSIPQTVFVDGGMLQTIETMCNMCTIK